MTPSRRFGRRAFTLGAGALLGTGLGFAVPGRAQAWVGDPTIAQPANNPYVGKSNTNASNSIALDNLNPAPVRNVDQVFWLVWAYAAPESSRHGEAAIRTRAVEEVDRISQLVTDGFWDILPALECVRLLRNDPAIPASQITTWLTRLRPAVQSNYDMNQANTEWMCFSPNTLHQSAAILQLASTLYNESSWTTMASSLVTKASAYQEANGVFRYSRGSGPAHLYFGFDATFLGRYYQLTQSTVAKNALTKMAGWADNILKNGLPEGSSAPWWKHQWAYTGAIYGMEVVAGVSQNSLARKVAQANLAQTLPYYYLYVAMYFWDPSITQAPALGADITRNDSNIGGPHFRRGAWQVVMLGKAYADTNIGLTVASGQSMFSFEGILKVAALPVMMLNKTDPYAGASALIVSADGDAGHRAALVNNSYIAIGSSCSPRYAYTSAATTPAAQAWTLTQVWYGDGQVLAGWIMVRATANSVTINGPRGLVRVGHAAQISSTDPKAFTSGNLVLKAWGTQVQSLQTATQSEFFAEGTNHHVWLNLSGVSQRVYLEGQQFGYGLSVVQSGASAPQVQLVSGTAQVLSAAVSLPSGIQRTIRYEPWVSGGLTVTDA